MVRHHCERDEQHLGLLTWPPLVAGHMRAHSVLARMVAVGRYHIRLRKSFARICPATRGYVFRVRMARSASLALLGAGETFLSLLFWVGIQDADPFFDLLGCNRIAAGGASFLAAPLRAARFPNNFGENVHGLRVRARNRRSCLVIATSSARGPRDPQTTSAKTCTPIEMLHGIGEVVCESPHQQESPRGAWQDIPVLPFAAKTEIPASPHSTRHDFPILPLAATAKPQYPASFPDARHDSPVLPLGGTAKLEYPTSSFMSWHDSSVLSFAATSKTEYHASSPKPVA